MVAVTTWLKPCSFLYTLEKEAGFSNVVTAAIFTFLIPQGCTI